MRTGKGSANNHPAEPEPNLNRTGRRNTMADNTAITLTIYEDEDLTVVRETKIGILRKIPFGVVRRLSSLLALDYAADDPMEILPVILRSWNDVCHILDRVFQGMTDDDWDRVDTSDVLRAILIIAKEAMKSIKKIPVKDSDAKN